VPSSAVIAAPTRAARIVAQRQSHVQRKDHPGEQTDGRSQRERVHPDVHHLAHQALNVTARQPNLRQTAPEQHQNAATHQEELPEGAFDR
jgi:hypothetical protein